MATNDSSSDVIGVLVISRHGDRSGFYQSPSTYTASDTALTPLGGREELQDGGDLRLRYLSPESNVYVRGIQTDDADQAQLKVIADASGEGSVIVDSAQALLQGLYPATGDTRQLANGTSVGFNRAQLIPIETVEQDQDVSLAGYIDCDNWNAHVQTFYNSDIFQQIQKNNSVFLSQLGSYVGNRSTSLENAWNFFDYLNVGSTWNASIRSQLDHNPSVLPMAHYLADLHEQGSFTDKTKDGIGNIVGQAILRPILDNLNLMANTSQDVKLTYLSVSYKPFISLFNLLELDLWGIVDYASLALFELHSDNTVRFLFRNGTSQTGPSSFLPYAMFPNSLPGSTPASTTLHQLNAQLGPLSIADLSSWCTKCGNTKTRGCGVVQAYNGSSSVTSTTGKHDVSPLAAGFIGAGISLALAAVLFALWLVLAGGKLGGGTVGRKRREWAGAVEADRGSVSSSTVYNEPRTVRHSMEKRSL